MVDGRVPAVLQDAVEEVINFYLGWDLVPLRLRIG